MLANGPESVVPGRLLRDVVPAALHAPGRTSLPLRVLPGEFRELSGQEGEVQLQALVAPRGRAERGTFEGGTRGGAQEPVKAGEPAQKQKRFQVTHVPACSPAGMRGPSVAPESPGGAPFAPHSSFWLLWITVPRVAEVDPGGAGISKRPFARPERLSVSGPPLRGPRSRPASLIPCRIRPGPFGSGLPSSLRFPGAGKIRARCPLPGSGSGHSR